MTRAQFEHVLRASGAITGMDTMVVVGSQAILGSHACPPDRLTVSLEVDLYPRDNPALADLIDGSIGELSPFHETFGYHAHGVGPETCILPDNWADRLVAFSSPATGGVVALCLSPVDVLLAKLAAGRDKDLEYARVLIEEQLVTLESGWELVERMPEASRSLVRERLARLTSR